MIALMSADLLLQGLALWFQRRYHNEIAAAAAGGAAGKSLFRRSCPVFRRLINT
jgi:hypothetical protein